jgi:hypothetical protein
MQIRIPGTVSPNAVVELGDWRSMFTDHIYRMLGETKEAKDIIADVLGEKERIEVTPRRGVDAKEAAIDAVYKKIQLAEGKYRRDIMSKETVRSFLPVDAMAFEPGVINIVTRDMPSATQQISGEMIRGLIKNSKDRVARSVDSAGFTGPSRAIHQFFDGYVNPFVKSMATDPMMGYIVRTIQDGHNMPDEMADAVKGRSLFRHLVSQMSNDSLYGVARDLRPYQNMDYMYDAFVQIDQEITKRMNAPVVDIPGPTPRMPLSTPIGELADTIRGKAPIAMWGIAGLATIGAMVNKAFVDRLPERERLKDDTSHITPDGTAMPGNARHGELLSPEMIPTTKGEGAGYNMRISGITSRANAEQIMDAMQKRYGAVRNIRRNKTGIRQRDIEEILGDMI